MMANFDAIDELPGNIDAMIGPEPSHAPMTHIESRAAKIDIPDRTVRQFRYYCEMYGIDRD